MIIALFDSDGTLYSAQFGRGLMRYASEHNRRSKVQLYYASLLPYGLVAKVLPFTVETFHRVIISRLAWLIKGYDRQQASEVFEWIADEYLLPTLRSNALERLRYHQMQGHRVMIVSGMFTSCLELISNQLGVSDWVGTQIELNNGRITGRVLPPVIKGIDKVEQVRRYFADRKLKVDWASSFAYGDSYSDHDMLEMVGNPTAVHPDPALRTLAQESGWQILED